LSIGGSLLLVSLGAMVPGYRASKLELLAAISYE
jgi:ABC-type lipoprotein release transport system permease subunit